MWNTCINSMQLLVELGQDEELLLIELDFKQRKPIELMGFKCSKHLKCICMQVCASVCARVLNVYMCYFLIYPRVFDTIS